MPEIETTRLRLRYFTLEDLDDLFRLYSDPEVMRYLSPRTREQTQASLRKHIKQWQENNFGMWAAIHKASGQMIGRCGLGFLENTPEVELGYVFDKHYWNRGIATEASVATLEYGFGEVKLEQIVAIAKPENIASVCVIEKVGMKYQKNTRYYGQGVVYYSILRSQWQIDRANSHREMGEWSGIQSSGLSGIIRSRFYPLCVPMQPTSSSKPQTDPPLPPKLTLPTMYDLPSEDPEEPGLPDEFHDLQPQLLSRTLRLIDYTNDRIFTGKNINLYYDVRHPLWHKRPDWFLVLDVPRLYEKTDLRSSYVVWQEGVNPFVVIELLSPGTQKEDLGNYAELEPMVAETTTDALSITSSESEQNNGQGVKETPPKKWDVYERILRVPYYAVFSRYTNRLRGFQLEGGHYQEQTIDSDNPRFWIPELKLGLGVWQGEFEGITRQWLRWYDSEGNWVLTDTEQEQKKRAKLTEKLRSLSPEQLEALDIDLQELE